MPSGAGQPMIWRASGARCGSTSTSRRRRPTRRCCPTAPCQGRAGSPAPRSTTPRTCSATWPPRLISPPCYSPRRRARWAASAGGSCTTACAPSPRGCAPWAWRGAIASSPICPTFPRRPSPFWPAPASGRSGRAAPPTSAVPAWPTASRRSSPACCSPSTATATTARRTTAWTL